MHKFSRQNSREFYCTRTAYDSHSHVTLFAIVNLKFYISRSLNHEYGMQVVVWAHLEWEIYNRVEVDKFKVTFKKFNYFCVHFSSFRSLLNFRSVFRAPIKVYVKLLLHMLLYMESHIQSLLTINWNIAHALNDTEKITPYNIVIGCIRIMSRMFNF